MNAPRERLRCSECHRPPRPDEKPLDEWRVYPYGLRELYLLCPECARREFSEDAPASGLVPLVWRRNAD